MWRYVLLGTVAGIGITVVVMLLGSGVFWLWVFGDDPWPTWAEVALVATAYSVGLGVFIGFSVVGYRKNRRP